MTQVPNIVLNNLWIDNLSRSKAMKELVEVNISYDTSFEDVELLRLEMEKFVRHPDNARDFQSDLVIGVGGVGDLDKLTLKIAIKHKSNWHNEAVRATRRSKFMCALALALKKVPIYAPGGGATPALGSSDNPAYSVTVDDNYASKARDKAANDADAARMVPLHQSPKRSDTTSTGGAAPPVQHVSERQAVQELTARPAVENEFQSNRDEDGDGRPDHIRDASPSTLRDPSPRGQGIEAIRAELVKRNSTRGRRRAGEGVPLSPVGSGQPNIEISHYDDGSRPPPRQFSYDVLDNGSGPYAEPSPRVAEAARESYSLYQQQQYPHGQAQQPQQPQQRYHASPPLENQQSMANPSNGRELTPGITFTPPAPTTSVAAASESSLAPARGARRRGASISGVENESRVGAVPGSAKKQYTK